MKNVLKAFANLFKAAKGVEDTTTTTTNGKNEISVFSFTEIGTVQQFELCKQVISASRNKETCCQYSTTDVETAKKMLSVFRKNHKTDNDRFLCIRNQSNAKTDVSSAIAKTCTGHTSEIQKDVHAAALGALNYALKKYNSNQVVTVSEIKDAFSNMDNDTIYKYYSVSTMQFNAKSLLAKCVDVAMKTKVRAQKESAKAQK